MRAEIEIEFGGVRDARIDCGAGRYVPGLARLLLLVGTEQPRVVALLNHDKSDARLVVRLQLDASFANRRQLVLQHLQNWTVERRVSLPFTKNRQKNIRLTVLNCPSLTPSRYMIIRLGLKRVVL